MFGLASLALVLCMLLDLTEWRQSATELMILMRLLHEGG